MKSHEVMKRAIDRVGIKSVAAELRLSKSLLYKWCEERPDARQPERSGATNPLDRVAALIRITRDPALSAWLCEQADGFFVENPKPPRPGQVSGEILQNTQRLLKEFSDVLDEVSRALRDDLGIDLQEAARIRREWEELKTLAEGFVRGCEQGHFATHPPPSDASR
jgi:hypothetical protein